MNATIYCGYCCKTGAGLEKPNIVAAARYYEYGARAGVAAAQYELARIYIDKEMGDACFIGGANPYIGCERWLKKAAEQNYIYAEELLADKYYEGAYIVKDVKAAIYWYEKAANQGSVYAMYQAATSTTLCQLTIIKLDSGSLLQRKKAIRMLKMYCATI